jgi:hypothetical protein
VKLLVGVLVVGCVLADCVGCGRLMPSASRSTSFSSFFMSHNAKTCLEAAAKAKGYQAGGGGEGRSMGGSTAAKDFSVSIKGDETIRDALMRDYKNTVESEMNRAGVAIHGRGTSGSVSAFDFTYDAAHTQGLIRANAVVGAKGYIEFDVFMYEHD